MGASVATPPPGGSHLRSQRHEGRVIGRPAPPFTHICQCSAPSAPVTRKLPESPISFGPFKFLGLSRASRAKQRPVARSKINNLRELLLWLYGNESTPSLIRSQNPDLNTLNEVLLDPTGIVTLRSGLPLSIAHEASLGDEKLFTSAVHNSKATLQNAHATLTTGFNPNNSRLMETAYEVESLASDLVEQMREKQARARRTKKKKKRTH